MARAKKLKTYDKQRDAVDKYRASNPQAPMGTTFPKAEKEMISSIFKAHGVTLAQVIRGAAAALRDGQSIRTESEPLTIPQEADGESDSTDTPTT